MIMLKYHFKKNAAPLLIIVPVILFLLKSTPYLGNNAQTYLDFSLIRQPLYSIFIWLFRWAHHSQFKMAMWAQGLLTLYAFLYARYWLKKHLQCRDIFIIPVFLFILVTVCFHYQMKSLDDPEGITFPLFIITFFYLVECFKKPNFKKIIVLSGLVSLLILARTQFYFFYSIFIILIIYHIWKKSPQHFILISSFIFILFAVLTNIGDRTYHYYMNGYFSNEPFSGVLTIIQPLYLAPTHAERYFKNPEEQYLIKILQRKIIQNNLNTYASTSNLSSTVFFKYLNQEHDKNYLAIQGIVNRTLTGIPFKYVYKVQDLQLIAMDKLTLDMTKTLFSDNIIENVQLYFHKVMGAMGGTAVFFFLMLFIIFALIKLCRDRKQDISTSELFIFLALLVTLCNALVVAVAEPNCTRYFCYTQFLFYCMGAYIANLTPKKNIFDQGS